MGLADEAKSSCDMFVSSCVGEIRGEASGV